MGSCNPSCPWGLHPANRLAATSRAFFLGSGQIGLPTLEPIRKRSGPNGDATHVHSLGPLLMIQCNYLPGYYLCGGHGEHYFVRDESLDGQIREVTVNKSSPKAPRWLLPHYCRLHGGSAAPLRLRPALAIRVSEYLLASPVRLVRLSPVRR